MMVRPASLEKSKQVIKILLRIIKENQEESNFVNVKDDLEQDQSNSFETIDERNFEYLSIYIHVININASKTFVNYSPFHKIRRRIFCPIKIPKLLNKMRYKMKIIPRRLKRLKIAKIMAYRLKLQYHI